MRVMASLMQPLNPATARLIRTGIYMDTADLRRDAAETREFFPLPLARFEDWGREHYVVQAARRRT